MIPLLLWLGAGALARDVCIDTDTTTDPFDQTEVLRIESTGRLLELRDGTPFYEADFTEPGISQSQVPPGRKVVLLLEDSTTITLFTTKLASPVPRAYASQYSAGVLTTWRLRFAMSPQAVHALARSPLVATRYTLSGEERTYELPERWQRTYQREFACLANHLPSSGAAEVTDG